MHAKMLDTSYQNMWTLSPELKTDSCICSWKLYTDHTCINYSHAEQVYECLLLRRSKYANYKVLCDLMSSFSFTTEDLRGSPNLHQFWLWFPAIYHSTSWLTYVIPISSTVTQILGSIVFVFQRLVWGNGICERPTYWYDTHSDYKWVNSSL